MSRAMLVYLVVCGAYISGVSAVRAQTLSADDALVVMHIEDLGVPIIESVIFKHVGSKEKIVIRCRKPREYIATKTYSETCMPTQPQVVKAGYYYLRSIVSIYSDQRQIILKRPSKDKFIEIKANAVTYLGSWGFKQNRSTRMGMDFEFDYSLPTLALYREQYSQLKDYPNYIAGQSGKLVSVKWEN